MKVDFWQLSRDPAEAVVGLIAKRVLGNGERLLVVSGNDGQRQAISRALWSSGPDSFLANGEASDKGAELQPVLISDNCEPVNGASHVIFADGTYRETSGFERAFLLFDDASLQDARTTWKALVADGDLERSFFRQEGGKWVKVA